MRACALLWHIHSSRSTRASLLCCIACLLVQPTRWCTPPSRRPMRRSPTSSWWPPLPTAQRQSTHIEIAAGAATQSKPLALTFSSSVSIAPVTLCHLQLQGRPEPAPVPHGLGAAHHGYPHAVQVCARRVRRTTCRGRVRRPGRSGGLPEARLLSTRAFQHPAATATAAGFGASCRRMRARCHDIQTESI